VSVVGQRLRVLLIDAVGIATTGGFLRDVIQTELVPLLPYSDRRLVLDRLN
jgi:hypothetical protein